jgi:hypothetical protein
LGRRFGAECVETEIGKISRGRVAPEIAWP